MVDIPGNTTTKAVLDTQDAELGTFSGRFETFGDHDFIKVSLINGLTYTFLLEELGTGSLTTGDANLTIRDANGLEKGLSVSSANPELFFTADATGTFFLDVSEHSGTHTGEYVLSSVREGTGIPFVPLTDNNDMATSSLDGEVMLGRAGAADQPNGSGWRPSTSRNCGAGGSAPLKG